MLIGKELKILSTLGSTYNELPPMLERHGLPEMGEAARWFGDAWLQFGRCERQARRSERDAASTGEKINKTVLTQIASFNKKGQKALRTAIAELRAAKGSFTPADAKEASPALKGAFEEFSSDLMPLISDGDLKPSDVTKLKSIVDHAVGIGNKGVSALADHVLEQMAELEELRKRPDRGAVDNIALWKLAAIAAFLGLWLIAVARCIVNRRQCSDVTNAALVAGMTIAWLVAYFC